MRAIRTTIALAAAALAAAAPAAAEAAKSPKAPQQAKFRATLSGSQVTTWEYHHVKDKDDPCDASSHGFGDQTIKFTAGRRFDLTFTKPPKNRPNLFQSNGRPAVLASPIFLTVAATAERNGQYQVNYGEIDRTRCDGVSGGDANNNPSPPDCGRREGTFHARLYFHEASPDDELFIPHAVPQPPEKNHLKLAGQTYAWNGADGAPAYGLSDAYKRCPLLLDRGYVEQAGDIWTSAAKIAERKLFQRKRRSIVISGHTIERYPGAENTGQTILAWNLRLKRVK